MLRPPSKRLAAGRTYDAGNMGAYPDLAQVGALVGDATRAAMLSELMDGRALTAGELAARAGVSPSTVSAHLARLVEGGLVVVVRQGRHAYVGLAGPGVASALESLAWLAPAAGAVVLVGAAVVLVMARPMVAGWPTTSGTGAVVPMVNVSGPGDVAEVTVAAWAGAPPSRVTASTAAGSARSTDNRDRGGKGNMVFSTISFGKIAGPGVAWPSARRRLVARTASHPLPDLPTGFWPTSVGTLVDVCARRLAQTAISASGHGRQRHAEGAPIQRRNGVARR